MRLAVLRLSAAALVLTGSALLAISVAEGSSSANSTTFDDAGSDARAGADVTRVRATNQDDGQLVFVLTLPNRESLVGSESIQLFIDTDRNGNTGSSGADFAISIFAQTGRVFIDKWTGSSFSRQRQSLDSAFSTRTLTLRARQAEFSLSGWFEFWIVTYSSPYTADTRTLGDRAPDSGRWRHNMTPGTIGTTTTTTTAAPADSDRDGVLDRSDACANRKAGPYDPNHNGCPGPFKTMSLRLNAPSRTFDNYTWWVFARPAVLGGAAPGAKVVIDNGSKREVGFADGGGRYESRLLTERKYPLGRVITFKVTRSRWIGAQWEIKILNRAPGFSTHRRLCIPPSGGSARDCRNVDRGS